MAIAIKFIYRYFSLFIVGIFLFIVIEPVMAQAETSKLDQIDTVWLIVAGSLVFFMNAGFAMLEAGLCQTRNATNVLAKNLIVFCVAIFAFWLLGFGLMLGNGNSWIGTTGFFFQAFDPPLINSFNSSFTSLQILYPQQPIMMVFFWQMVFAGTAATIVSGAMAERIKFWAFFWFSFCLVAIAYPLTARWAWNPQGWLATYHFIDFAGSTVVHSVGGMAGLVGTMIIGPRRGWQGYNPDLAWGDRFTDNNQSFQYYNLSLSTLGCLILWLGWLGFNGGSARSISDVPHIIITTMLAGASGGIFILLLRGLRGRKPSLSLLINGILGGLVSITASSALVSLAVALLIGAISSIAIIFGEQLLNKLKIDDPVGAIPVHLICGIWGTLAAGIFVNQIPPYINDPVIRVKQIIVQLAGILAINLATLILSAIFWLAIGLSIHLIESLNNQLKGSIKESMEDEKIMPQNIVSRYIHLARTALRVSLKEEIKGSDGTFS